jgi:hypothetical protein
VTPVHPGSACRLLRVQLGCGSEGITLKEIGHTSGFLVSGARTVLWVSAGRYRPQGCAEQSGHGHCSRDRRSQCRRIRSLHMRAGATPMPRGARGVVPRTSRAPEGGGTTQRGDPAPGPMRCGTTASGEERMHP